MIELQHGELGIVFAGNAFIAKITIDLIDAVESSYQQALQIQLRGDAQVEIEIKRVVARDERARGGPAGDSLHHRCFHFDVTARIEERAQSAQNFGAPEKCLSNTGVNDKVEVALPVTEFHVRQTMPFLWQGEQSFGKQLQGVDPDRQFIRFGPKQVAGNANDVAQIQQLKEMECPLTDGIELDVYL